MAAVMAALGLVRPVRRCPACLGRPLRREAGGSWGRGEPGPRRGACGSEWYGICLSDVGDFEGIKTKIGNAFVIKEHFQRAIELNPKDATTIHLIGIWCYSFAEMPWYQRKIAATLFATPPTSTFQEALRYFHMAEEADPNFYSKNLLFLGKTYLKLNNKKMALLWLSKAKDYPAHTEEDKQVQKEALELLNSI